MGVTFRAGGLVVFAIDYFFLSSCKFSDVFDLLFAPDVGGSCAVEFTINADVVFSIAAGDVFGGHCEKTPLKVTVLTVAQFNHRLDCFADNR